MAPKVVAAWKRFTKIRMKVKDLLQAEEQLKGRLTHLQEQLQGAINEMERVVRKKKEFSDLIEVELELSEQWYHEEWVSLQKDLKIKK